MRFLLDQNRSPVLAELLREAGHNAVHTLDLGLEEAEDDEVLDAAEADQRIVVSGDTDFGALLALTHKRSPSVILFRTRNLPSAADQAGIMLQDVDDIEEDLAQGAVVVVSDDRIRIRRLPLLHEEQHQQPWLSSRRV